MFISNVTSNIKWKYGILSSDHQKWLTIDLISNWCFMFCLSFDRYARIPMCRSVVTNQTEIFSFSSTFYSFKKPCFFIPLELETCDTWVILKSITSFVGSMACVLYLILEPEGLHLPIKSTDDIVCSFSENLFLSSLKPCLLQQIDTVSESDKTDFLF